MVNGVVVNNWLRVKMSHANDLKTERDVLQKETGTIKCIVVRKVCCTWCMHLSDSCSRLAVLFFLLLRPQRFKIMIMDTRCSEKAVREESW